MALFCYAGVYDYLATTQNKWFPGAQLKDQEIKKLAMRCCRAKQRAMEEAGIYYEWEAIQTLGWAKRADKQINKYYDYYRARMYGEGTNKRLHVPRWKGV